MKYVLKKLCKCFSCACVCSIGVLDDDDVWFLCVCVCVFEELQRHKESKESV